MRDAFSIFSATVPRSLDSFREVEKLKKDFFDSQNIIVNEPESEDYLHFMRSQRWWLEYKSWKESFELYFYYNWHVPVEFLRFSNELFVEQEDLNEVQVIWDKAISRYYLKRTDCRDTTDENQLPIVRLFKEHPEKEPNGIWGVCKRPKDIDNPYSYYGVEMFKKLGTVVDTISETSVFS